MFRLSYFTILYITLCAACVTANNHQYHDENEKDYEVEELQRFNDGDLNNDHVLSRQEFHDLLALEYIDQIEHDSHSEYMTFFNHTNIVPKISEADKDGNGKLSRDEALHAVSIHLMESGESDDMFDTFDADSDGVVTWKEYFPEDEYFEYDDDDDLGDDDLYADEF